MPIQVGAQTKEKEKKEKQLGLNNYFPPKVRAPWENRQIGYHPNTITFDGEVLYYS